MPKSSSFPPQLHPQVGFLSPKHHHEISHEFTISIHFWWGEKPLTFRSKCHKRAALTDAFAAAAAVASCCEASAGGDVMGFPWDFDGT
jgi:hypothetical protein